MSNTDVAAVEFDVVAFRSWLETEGTDGRKQRESDPYLSVSYAVLDGEPGWLTSSTLCSIKDNADVWRLAEGVKVDVHVLADAEGGDDGVIVEVLVDGQWLSAGRIEPAGLIPVSEDERLPGYEAAIIALENVAKEVNERVEHYRAAHPAPLVAQVVA